MYIKMVMYLQCKDDFYDDSSLTELWKINGILSRNRIEACGGRQKNF